MPTTKLANFNGKKFRADLAKKGLSMTAAAEKIGYAPSSLTQSVRLGKIQPRKLHALCDVIGLDEISYIIPPEPSKEPAEAPVEAQSAGYAQVNADALSGIEKRLDAIVAALDKIASAMQIRHPVFGKVENCILILQALTSYGACHYANFESKCRAAGMDEDCMNQALNITGYRVFIGDGIKQIKRK